MVAYLDRVNVGFAKLQMLDELDMSDTAYGIGAGIFFIGFFLVSVPSNLMVHRIGARVWIARIMVTWGVLSAATMFVTSEWTFFAIRFALGAAEAGFFPGIILYLTQWYPATMRARIVALFMTAVAVSGVIGGPVSGWILVTMAGVNDWAGWQWLFLLEGIPSVVMGIGVFFYLDDRITTARWLSDAEKALLQQNIDAEQRSGVQLSILATLRNRRVLLLSALYFAFIIGLYGIGFWLPQLIATMGVTDLWRVGLLSAIPYGFAAVVMVLVARSSDRMRERRWHMVTMSLIGASGLAAAGWFSTEQLAGMIALTVATVGILSVVPVFWTLPTSLLRGASAAVGIAVVNSIGNLAGFLGPYMIGAIRDATGSATNGVYTMAGFMLLGALLTIPATASAPQHRAVHARE